MLKKFENKIIGVLCGGVSAERPVSLRSGDNVYQCLIKNGYQAVLIDLTHVEDLESQIKKNRIDIIFNVLHGYFGEDGRLQGILDYLKIPYTGSGMAASALSMNKLWTKLIAKGLNIPVSKEALLLKGKTFDIDSLKLQYPLIVKPISGGSSIETYIIKNAQEFEKINFQEKNLDFLIEEFIEGIEVTAGILENEGQIINLPILQLNSSNAFYDYEAKYTAGKTDFILPAPLEPEVRKKVDTYARTMHMTLGCKGATRCDFIIHEEIPYFLEINTSSGMTELSDIPAACQSMGIELLELCEIILSKTLSHEF